MAIGDIGLFRTIRTKMQWHSERQGVLSENVANAETPGYRPRDLAPPDFGRDVARSRANLVTLRTDGRHIEGTLYSTRGAFRAENAGSFEITPDGNGVVLEEQMMKVTENQLDFQTASSLYQRGVGLLKTAIGR